MTDLRGDMTQRRRRAEPTLLDAFRIQVRVIGAVMMRELHTRYGRDNIGYLWLIGEPLMLGSAIALIHGIRSSRGGDASINPIAFGIVGYSIFIIWRGLISRAGGALESNAPLLHHRMVSIFDICVARGLLELAGCTSAFVILVSAGIGIGFMSLPARPLYLVLGIFYVFWISFSLAMIVTGGTYERPALERLVHPLTYFSMPLSGAFYRMSWIPNPYREWLMWFPVPQIFEIVRHGQFASATLEYADITYVTICCMVLFLIGLLLITTVKERVHVG